MLARYSDLLRSCSEDDIKSDITLSGRLLLEKAGSLSVSYAPFEHIEQTARVVIVGITPGIQQATNALLEARRQLLAGRDVEVALKAAKVFASFSGPMRANLIAMLDHIAVSRWLGIQSTSDLWKQEARLVHFTSALRYPVLVAGANYNGHPSPLATPALQRLLNNCLVEEARSLPSALWVPLGPVPSQAMSFLTNAGHIDPSRVLDGMPHPSGANGERIAYFLGRKPRAELSKLTNAGALDASKRALMEKVRLL